MIVFMMAQLDGSVVAVANPVIAADLGVGASALSWTFSSYLLVMAMIIVPAGDLVDRVGPRRAFQIGVAMFTLASIACGCAASWVLLVCARAVQGAGGALLLASSVGVLRLCFSPGRFERIFGMVAGLAAVAFASGPLVGAALVSWPGWRSVFLINVPLGIAASGLAAVAIPRASARVRRRLDLVGLALLGLGTGALVWGVTAAGGSSWAVPEVLWPIVCGIALVVLFVVYERRHAVRPLVPSEAWRAPDVVVAAAVLVCYAFILFGLVFAITLQGQVDGASPLALSVVLLPLCASITVAGPTAGWATQRWGPRPVILMGFTFAAAGSCVLGVVPNLRLSPVSALVLTVAGAGLAGVQVASNTLLVMGFDEQRSGFAGALAGLVTQVGGACGVAVVGSVAGASGPSTLRVTVVIMCVVLILGSTVTGPVHAHLTRKMVMSSHAPRA
ncbi:MFS transporter [Amycolatopsis thermoflava]